MKKDTKIKSGVTGFDGDIVLRVGVNAKSYREAEIKLRLIGETMLGALKEDYPVKDIIEIKNVTL